jgi:hypothetical protein
VRVRTERRSPEAGKWFFLVIFLFACFLFWWLPSVLFRLVTQVEDTLRMDTIATSLAALTLFILGYLMPWRSRARSVLPEPIMAGCEEFAYRAVLLLALPSLLVAIVYFRSRAGVDYGTGDPIPTSFQAILYAHLFFGFLYLGASEPDKRGWRRLLMVIALITLPRLIDSLRGGRFFLAQAIVPVVLMSVARGWIRISARRVVQFLLLAAGIIFVPSLTRGDNYIGGDALVQFFASGSSLHTYQDNVDLDLAGRCPPLLVSLTAKTVPYHWLGVCTIDVWTLKGIPATLDRILAYGDPMSQIALTGPGSNFLLELSLTGGLPAVFIGSALFGFTCRRFVGWIGRRSLFAGIWAECLTRALFAPRNDLGYVYERIPSLILATLLVVFLVGAAGLLKQQFNDPVPRAPSRGIAPAGEQA